MDERVNPTRNYEEDKKTLHPVFFSLSLFFAHTHALSFTYTITHFSLYLLSLFAPFLFGLILSFEEDSQARTKKP